MSSSSSGAWVVAVIFVPRPVSLVVVREPGGVSVGLRQVGKGETGGPGGMVDPVPDDWSVAGVDQLGEQDVDHVVVESPAPARRMSIATSCRELDLQVGAGLHIRLGHVDDQVVREDEIR